MYGRHLRTHEENLALHAYWEKQQAIRLVVQRRTMQLTHAKLASADREIRRLLAEESPRGTPETASPVVAGLGMFVGGR